MAGPSLNAASVPRQYDENLIWRRFLWTKMENKGPERQAIMAACARNPLFYLNSFMWVYEARLKRCQPIITWPDQEDYINLLTRNLRASLRPENQYRRFDVGVLKGRDLGATVLSLGFLDWLCRFHREVECLCISAKEDRVDNPKDNSALFQKLDYIEARLPNCLRVRGTKMGLPEGRANLRVEYPRTNSIITGESSNENAGAGGRYLIVLRDEEARCPNGQRITNSLYDTTRFQLRVSTPQGTGNSFHTAWLKKSCDWKSLHWWKHPHKAAGLYESKNGVIRVIDKKWHEQNPGYQFRTGQTDADPGQPFEFLRSPWADETQEKADSRCDWAGNHQLSFLGSGSPFFMPEKLANMRAKHQRAPIEQGHLSDFLPKLKTPDEKTSDTDPRPFRAKIWFNRLANGRPPQDTTYTIGADIAAGSGASDSTISVIDDNTYEKVFEFITNGAMPTVFAYITTQIYEWFTTDKGRPFLSWDSGNHGIPYGRVILDHPGVVVYHHINETGERAKWPGYPVSRKLKYDLIEQYREALFQEVYTTPSKDEYDQAEQFVHDGNGSVCHELSLSTEDKSARGEQHGDIVTSAAIAWIAANKRPTPEPVEPEIPVGCLAWRRRQEALRERENQTMFAGKY